VSFGTQYYNIDSACFEDGQFNRLKKFLTLKLGKNRKDSNWDGTIDAGVKESSVGSLLNWCANIQCNFFTTKTFIHLFFNKNNNDNLFYFLKY
jgi:hypothetical protein